MSQRLLLVAAVLLWGCGAARAEQPSAGASVEGEVVEFATTPRKATDRSVIPAALAPQIPRRGLYAAGGGLLSSAWRVSVDLDRGVLSGGESEDANSSSIGKMDREWEVALGAADLKALLAAADAAWREPPGDDFVDPTIDYGELVVVADGDAIFYFDGYGPIRRPAAAALVEALRRAAGMR